MDAFLPSRLLPICPRLGQSGKSIEEMHAPHTMTWFGFLLVVPSKKLSQGNADRRKG